MYEAVIRYLKANGVTKPSFSLQDDGDGVFISKWGHRVVAQPTAADLAPYMAIEENNQPILEQIAALELQITPRRVREAMLTPEGKAWLQSKESQIAALRSGLL